MVSSPPIISFADTQFPQRLVHPLRHGTVPLYREPAHRGIKEHAISSRAANIEKSQRPGPAVILLQRQPKSEHPTPRSRVQPIHPLRNGAVPSYSGLYRKQGELHEKIYESHNNQLIQILSRQGNSIDGQIDPFLWIRSQGTICNSVQLLQEASNSIRPTKLQAKSTCIKMDGPTMLGNK